MQSYFLYIETSGKICSVALATEKEVIAHEESSDDFSHAEKLSVFIEKLLLSEGIEVKDLAGIGISSGPGSYTGLRIGVATAKGLCFAHDIPLYGVNTLEALFFGNNDAQQKSNILTSLDSRQNEIYYALYNSKGDCIKQAEPAIVDEDFMESLIPYLPLQIKGMGGEKIQEFNPDIPFAFILPKAEFLHKSVQYKHGREEAESLVNFVPEYLKPVHINIKKKK